MLVGHGAFSPATIDGEDISCFDPRQVSIDADNQGVGIGPALIRVGLEQLRSRGTAGCVVPGDPAYYSRFGFDQRSRPRDKIDAWLMNACAASCSDEDWIIDEKGFFIARYFVSLRDGGQHGQFSRK